MSLKWAATVALVAAAVGLWGCWVALNETVTVAFYHRRPHVLRFGPRVRLGSCFVSETADPRSDVLANLIDVDADGRSDFRVTGSYDGTTTLCERRHALWWRGVDMSLCQAASRRCSEM